MSDSKSYSKKEISKILTKASEIQVKKDLYEDQETLSEEDLIHIAEEVGISKEALQEALAKIGEPDLDEQTYNLIKGTSRIQDVSSVEGEINEDQWEDLVLEIRKITGGIGKINKVGNTYEWEQRKSDFGYKHFSFTPKNGQTKIQMVSSWGPFKSLASFLSFFFGFIVALIAFKETSGKQFALMVAPFFGLGGFAMSRFFLKSYYQKQKDQLSTLTASISKKIASFGNTSGPIEIEDEDLYQENVNSTSSQPKERNT
ncbi:MAG: hypothetical protein CL670_12050 [Balneola sp.]|jgi:hypothetical protein|nr:hypothetical protein [Balneola sp.]MBE79880.1 hypothetical protein [Balneola sp.]|tara:strand:+ start:1064 stop:1837 length:774 start_codon:yes stop_codon:yes gene_type:complete